MKPSSNSQVDDRRQQVLLILEDERARTRQRILTLRREQGQDATPAPADELDEARALAEVETHASLIEAAEKRLQAIDNALERLAGTHYGLCEECGNEIPVERLQVLPFTTYCIACQRKRDDRGKASTDNLDEKAYRVWAVPAGMNEPLEQQDALVAPEERLVVHDQRPFGAELGEFEQSVPAPTMGRRGRIKPKPPGY